MEFCVYVTQLSPVRCGCVCRCVCVPVASMCPICVHRDFLAPRQLALGPSGGIGEVACRLTQRRKRIPELALLRSAFWRWILVLAVARARTPSPTRVSHLNFRSSRFCSTARHASRHASPSPVAGRSSRTRVAFAITFASESETRRESDRKCSVLTVPNSWRVPYPVS